MKSDKKFMSSTKAFVAAATLVSTTLTATTPALADNYKSFPGGMCDGATFNDRSRLFRGDLEIHNLNTSQYANVTCPIVRGAPGDDDGTTDGPSSLVYVEKGNSLTMSCSLIGDWSAGGGFTGLSGSTSAQGITYISIPKIAKRNIYGIRCNLPPSSKILAYYSFFK